MTPTLLTPPLSKTPCHFTPPPAISNAPCRDPIDRMIAYFCATFAPDRFEDGASLAITGGRGGARLTHSHERCVPDWPPRRRRLGPV